LHECGWQWLQARKPNIVEGKLKFDQPKTEAVAEKMLELVELHKKEQFKRNREKDLLSAAIGSKEHGGYVGGVSPKLSIKDEFQKDRARYRCHCFNRQPI